MIKKEKVKLDVNKYFIVGDNHELYSLLDGVRIYPSGEMERIVGERISSDNFGNEISYTETEVEDIDWKEFVVCYRGVVDPDIIRMILPILERRNLIAYAFQYYQLPLELIDRYKSENTNVKYSLTKSNKLPIEWIRDNLKYLDPIQIQVSQELTSDILDELAPNLNGDLISEHQKLDYDWAVANLQSLNVRYLIYYQDWTNIEFVELLLNWYKDWHKIPWEAIVESIRLTDDFILDYWRWLPKSTLLSNQVLSPRIIEAHFNEFVEGDYKIINDSPLYKDRGKKAYNGIEKTIKRKIKQGRVEHMFDSTLILI